MSHISFAGILSAFSLSFVTWQDFISQKLLIFMINW